LFLLIQFIFFYFGFDFDVAVSIDIDVVGKILIRDLIRHIFVLSLTLLITPVLILVYIYINYINTKFKLKHNLMFGVLNIIIIISISISILMAIYLVKAILTDIDTLLQGGYLGKIYRIYINNSNIDSESESVHETDAEGDSDPGDYPYDTPADPSDPNGPNDPNGPSGPAAPAGPADPNPSNNDDEDEYINPDDLHMDDPRLHPDVVTSIDEGTINPFDRHLAFIERFYGVWKKDTRRVPVRSVYDLTGRDSSRVMKKYRGELRKRLAGAHGTVWGKLSDAGREAITNDELRLLDERIIMKVGYEKEQNILYLNKKNRTQGYLDHWHDKMLVRIREAEERNMRRQIDLEFERARNSDTWDGQRKRESSSDPVSHDEENKRNRKNVHDIWKNSPDPVSHNKENNRNRKNTHDLWK